MNEGDATREVTLPTALIDRVEARLPRTDFEDADAYITHVLEEVLDHVEAETAASFNAATHAEIQDRLEALGYLTE